VFSCKTAFAAVVVLKYVNLLAARFTAVFTVNLGVWLQLSWIGLTFVEKAISYQGARFPSWLGTKMYNAYFGPCTKAENWIWLFFLPAWSDFIFLAFLFSHLLSLAFAFHILSASNKNFSVDCIHLKPGGGTWSDFIFLAFLFSHLLSLAFAFHTSLLPAIKISVLIIFI